MTSPQWKSIPSGYKTAVAIARPLLMAGTKRRWGGQEHLPPLGTGFIACPNHISHFDFLAFAHYMYDSGRPVRFLGKESVFRIPVVGAIIRAADQIPVHRGTARAGEAFSAAVAAVRAGKAVAVYPEGTLTRDPDLWPMTGKTGAARIALTTEAPVIPIGQWGAQEVIGRYQKHFKPLPRKTMQIQAGPPVDLSDLYGRPLSHEVLREATDRITDATTAIVAQLRGETPPAVRFDTRKAGLPETGRFTHDPARETPAPEEGQA
ncbi:MAG: 1-acyl-sn-glycerol-3-phosphate acyltransferase [Micrococcales bacterium]|nr:1-acyl-sn-glycerol-3-phosphate acyltransferase [Micrococcales bacterium]